MGTDADDIIDLYDRHARAWVGARLQEGRLYERGWLNRFCELVLPEGSVLDLGCGAGQPIAAYLIERGFAVTGVDSSKTMIAMFQARLPGHEALIADMRTLSLGRVFHGILAWDSFFHLARTMRHRQATSFWTRGRRW